MQNFDLKGLKMDQIYKAFAIARASFDVPGKKLVLVTREHCRKAIDFTRQNFLLKEPTNQLLNVQYTSTFKDYWTTTLKHNLSLMITDDETDNVVAILRIKVQCIDEKPDLTDVPSKPAQNKMLLCSYCSRKADFFGYYGITQAFHLIGLAVSHEHQQKGLASIIVNFALCMIKNLGIQPCYVKAESSSVYAQKIFEKAGFETLFELSFDNWIVDGKQLNHTTDVHKSRKIYGLSISAEAHFI